MYVDVTGMAVSLSSAATCSGPTPHGPAAKPRELSSHVTARPLDRIQALAAAVAPHLPELGMAPP